jgi:hypothetical protein
MFEEVVEKCAAGDLLDFLLLSLFVDLEHHEHFGGDVVDSFAVAGAGGAGFEAHLWSVGAEAEDGVRPELDVGDGAVVDQRAMAAHGRENPAAVNQRDAGVDPRDMGVGDDDVVALLAADRDFTLIGETPGLNSVTLGRIEEQQRDTAGGGEPIVIDHQTYLPAWHVGGVHERAGMIVMWGKAARN